MSELEQYGFAEATAPSGAELHVEITRQLLQWLAAPRAIYVVHLVLNLRAGGEDALQARTIADQSWSVFAADPDHPSRKTRANGKVELGETLKLTDNGDPANAKQTEWCSRKADGTRSLPDMISDVRKLLHKHGWELLTSGQRASHLDVFFHVKNAPLRAAHPDLSTAPSTLLTSGTEVFFRVRKRPAATVAVAPASANSVTTLQTSDPPATIEFLDGKGNVVSVVYPGQYDNAVTTLPPKGFNASKARLDMSPDETKDFIGRDSRRFRVRITAPGLVPGPNGRIKAAWRTWSDAAATSAIPYPLSTIELTRSSNPDQWLSPWLMLAPTDWEMARAPATVWSRNVSGFPGETAEIEPGQPGFRMRKCVLGGATTVSFPPGSSNRALATVYTPGDIKTVPIRVCLVQGRSYPDDASIYAAIEWIMGTDIKSLRQTYARIGMRFETDAKGFADSKPFMLDADGKAIKAARFLNHAADYVHVIPWPATVDDTQFGSDAITQFANVVPADGHLRLFYVAGLANNAKGETINGWGSGKFDVEAAVFRVSNNSGSAMAHEIGHCLTYTQDVGGAPGDGHYAAGPGPRFRELNLMCDGIPAGNYFNSIYALGTLWVDPDSGGYDWYTKLRGHRFAK